ncbi:hypothetical protein [Streptomyces sp. NPDC060322]|uniref:hypothetical protein n=1 Tax=Streptomyces sp. NPDC060322 TaxID=3347097 RepID=UPI0036473BC9
MILSVGSTLALTSAEPGWSVKVTDLSDGDPVICPVVAWASVVTSRNEDGSMKTAVHPVFLAHGDLWTGPEYPLGPAPVVVPPLT